MTKRWVTVERNIERDSTAGRYRVRLAHGRKRDDSPRVVVKTFDTLADARAFRDVTKAAMGRNPALGLHMTLDEYFEHYYLPAYSSKSKAKASQVAWVKERYANQISGNQVEAHELPFGQRLVEDPISIDQAQRAICDNPAWSPRTARAAIGIYRSIYDYLYDERVVDRKPWGDHRFSYGTEVERKEGADRRDAYTPAEVVEVCRKLEEGGSPLATLAACMFGAGLRPSEAFALDRADIQFAELDDIGLVARIHIHKSASKYTEGDLIAQYAKHVPGVKLSDSPAEVRAKVRAYALEEGIDLTVNPGGKNNLAERWVSVSEPFSSIIYRTTADLNPGDPICRNVDGTRRKPHNVPQAWRKCFAEGGPLEDMRFVQLKFARHSGNTLLRKSRISLADTKLYRGHAAELGLDATSYFDPTDPEMFDYVAEKVYKYLRKEGLV